MAEEASLTIEEWNAIRAKQGLKPLNNKKVADEALGSSKRPRDRLAAEAERREAQRDVAAESRKKQRQKEYVATASGQGLGDILARDEGSSVKEWAANFDPAKAKREAAKRDEREKRRQQKVVEDEEHDLSQFHVTHDLSDFKEGESAILTLADTTILTDKGKLNEDVNYLENVERMEAFKLQKRDEAKNEKAYDPVDELLASNDINANTDILKKYNEKQTRPDGFSLAHVSPEDNLKKLMADQDQVKTSFRGFNTFTTNFKSALNDASGAGVGSAGAVSVGKTGFPTGGVSESLKFQTDIMNPEETKAFFKKQKKKKQGKKRKRDGDDEEEARKKRPAARLNIRDADSDEEDVELYEQMKRTQTAGGKKKESALTELVRQVGAGKEEEIRGQQTLSTTTQFCETVETTQEKMQTAEQETYAGMALFKQEKEQKRKLQRGKADEEEKKHHTEDDKVEDYLHEKPLDSGISSALHYLRDRTELGKDQYSHFLRHNKQGGVLEMGTDEDDIRLEYRDEFGRVPTKKEQFRVISWKFHGKQPAAKNAEKRKQKLELEQRLKRADMTDLPTLRALKQSQKTENKAHMVLS